MTEQMQEAAEPPVYRRFEITAHADGSALVIVEAADEDDAVAVAYEEHLTGIDIGCGVANWEIDHVREVA